MERYLLLTREVSEQTQPETPVEGRYANGLRVGYNAFEFVLDFIQQYGADDAIAVHTRVVTSPAYTKAFLETLSQSVAGYEAEFGEIGVTRAGTGGP